MKWITATKTAPALKVMLRLFARDTPFQTLLNQCRYTGKRIPELPQYKRQLLAIRME
ncbi:MAG: hypothetical protein E7G33_17295 [Bacteroides sp.]|nr:hypothetical protein [Bacteroides sp.]